MSVAKLMYTQNGKCSYFDRVRRQFTRSNMDLRGIQSAWDLEDIVNFGQQMKVSYIHHTSKLSWLMLINTAICLW